MTPYAIGSTIELRDSAAKKRRGRIIPIHSSLRDALTKQRPLSDGIGPIIRSEPMTGAALSLRGQHASGANLAITLSRPAVDAG